MIKGLHRKCVAGWEGKERKEGEMERLRTDQAMNEVNNQSNQCKMPSIQTSKKKKEKKVTCQLYWWRDAAKVNKVKLVSWAKDSPIKPTWKENTGYNTNLRWEVLRLKKNLKWDLKVCNIL